MTPEESKAKYRKFKDLQFRAQQSAAIEFVVNSSKPVVALCAPCGSGKSLIGACVGNYYDKFSYLCSSKQLQEQLQFDFPETEVMMGRGNYECNLIPSKMADECIHSELFKCPLKYSTCNYELQKRATLKSHRQIINYAYAITEAHFVGKFSGYPVQICDEADMLESILVNFVSLDIRKSTLRRYSIPTPAYKTSQAKMGVESWKVWAQRTEEIIRNRARRVENSIDLAEGENPDDDTKSAMRELKWLEGFQKRLQIFLKYVDKDWIYETNDRGWMFRPVWLTPAMTQEWFFKHAQKHLLMSATVPKPKILSILLGIDLSDIDYMEVPSTWPVSNRPVHLMPVADMKYKTFKDDVPKLLKRIGEIINNHKNEKGVIHTSSWKLTDIVMSIANGRMVTHTPFNKPEMLRKFQLSDKPLIFVSPSSTRGVNLPGDNCRFQIIAKAPYLSLKDKVVNARIFGSKVGQSWYRALCADDILQACYRGVRSEDDWCVTYCLDKQIMHLITGHQSLFSKYFLQAIEI